MNLFKAFLAMLFLRKQDETTNYPHDDLPAKQPNGEFEKIVISLKPEPKAAEVPYWKTIPRNPPYETEEEYLQVKGRLGSSDGFVCYSKQETEAILARLRVRKELNNEPEAANGPETANEQGPQGGSVDAGDLAGDSFGVAITEPSRRSLAARQHTDESLLDALYMVRVVAGKYPTESSGRWIKQLRKFTSKFNVPYPSTYRRRFGSIARACELAELRAIQLNELRQSTEGTAPAKEPNTEADRSNG